MLEAIPPAWEAALGDVAASEGYRATCRLVAQARTDHPDAIYPPAGEVFRALELTPLDSVRAVIIGQDPYPGQGEAHGLAFSFLGNPDRLPASLRRIRKELRCDVGVQAPPSGSLEPWAREGVLLLNTILTVQRDIAGSHRRFGWQAITDAVLSAVARKPDPVVFLLWGKAAQSKRHLVTPPHVAIPAPHPVARSGNAFLGQRPFSKANAALIAADQPPISWRL